MDTDNVICIECGEVVEGKASSRRADGPTHEVCPRDRHVTSEGLDWIPPDLASPGDTTGRPPDNEEDEGDEE